MAQNKKWALDTNVIFDVARNLDQANTLREIALEKKYTLHISPTSLEEIAHKTLKGDREEQKLAHRALRNLTQWKISAFEYDAEFEAAAGEFSAFLRNRRVLPRGEINDGIILAEASLAGAALLVSSDSHLTDIDPDELRLIFEERGLTSIPVITPAKLLHIFEKHRNY